MTEARPNKRNKIVMIAIALVIVLAVGGGAVFAFFINTPKNHYFRAEATTFAQTEAQLNERFANMVKYNEWLATKPSHSKLTLKGSLEANNNPDVAMFQDLLSKLNIVINEQRDPKKKFVEDTVSLSFDKSEPLKATFFVHDNTAGVYSKQLHDKSFFLKGSEFGKFMKRMDATYKGATKYDFNTLFEKRQTLTEADLDYLTTTYGDVLEPFFKNENFKEEDGRFEYEGKTFTATKITWSASGADTKAMLQALVKHAVKDEKLFTMLERLLDPTQTLNTLEGAANPLAELKKALADIEKEIAKKTFDNGISSTIYVNDDNIILKREIEFKAKQHPATITTYNVTMDGKAYDELSIHSTDDKTKLSFKNIHSAKKDRLTLSTTSATENMSVGVEAEEVAKDHYRFTLVSEGEGELSTLLDSTEIALDVKTNFDFANDKAAVNYQFHFNNENEAMKFTIESSTTSKFGSAKSTIQLTDQAINVATERDETLNKVAEDVTTNAMETEFVQSIQQAFMAMMFGGETSY